MQGSKAHILNCGNECIESFKAHRTQTQLRQLPLPNFYCAAANNSGPIALLYQKYNTKQIKLPQTFDNSIIIFNCRGELIRTIPFDLKQRIIVFEFTIDQSLLIVYATGVHFIVDIATAEIQQRHFLSEQESKGKNRFIGGQMIADKIILQREKTIGIVQGLENKWKALPTVRFHSEFPVFECNSLAGQNNIYKREADIEICYLNTNYQIETSIIRGKEKVGNSSVIYSHPELRILSPLLVSLSHKNGFLVMVFTDFVLLINTKEQKSQKSIEAPTISKSSIEVMMEKPSNSSSQKMIVNQSGKLSENSFQLLKKAFKDKILFFKKFKVQRDNLLSKSSSGLKYRKFYKIGWLNNVCYFSDAKKLILFTLLEPRLTQVPVTESSFLLAPCQKILRVIDENTYVLRVINNPIYYYLADQLQAENKCYKNANSAFQQKYNTFRNILLIYENFIQKKPNSISELKKHKEQAEEVWEQLMNVVQLAMDPGLQLKILKVASWIHSMYGMAKQVRQLLSRLRVINGLKYEHWNRWLSYEQFQGLKSTRFLTMLLKSNMHYVADLIFQDSQSKKVIFLHWAKCKIQKQTPSTALDQIKQRYNDMKTDLQSKYVFSELALYCLHREQSLSDLAIKLAESQTHPVRKCMVFLLVFKKKHSLDLIDKLLEFAENSFNNNIIHQTLSTLRNLRNQVPETAWLQLLPKKPFLQAFYLRMLRSEYNQEEIQRYMEVNKFYTDLAYLSLKNQLKQINNTTLEAVVPILQRDYAKILSTLTQQVSRCQPCKGIAKLRELKQKSSPISQNDVDSFTKDQQFQALGELIAVKDKNMALAVRIFKKIKSQKVYQILRVKGKLKDAIDLAFQRKNKLKLQELVVELGGDDDDSTYGRQLLKQLNQTM